MKLAKQVLGMGIFSIILGALTWISTDVYIVALNIGSSGAALIHTATVIFWVLFIFSFLSGEMISSAHIKFIYRLCNIVFGIMFYLFLGSVILSVLLLLYPTISSTTASIVVLISFILSIIGLVQARNLSTTSYTVSLPNAPLSWNGKRAIFLSDTHFGLMNHKRFSDKIVNKILSLNPDFVMHGGDFYDGPAIDTKPISESWKKVTDKIPVFYTSGNHEMYGPYESFIESIRGAGITVLLDEKVLHDGVQIAGITYRAKGKDKDAHKALESLNIETNIPLILINHPPTFHKSAHSLGSTLMLSGHTHRGQFSPIGLITRLIYKRFNYGFNEFQNMKAITSRGVGTAGPPMRLFNAPELVIITFNVK
jgi:predicted MPP superfamily phosphohydrolase